MGNYFFCKDTTHEPLTDEGKPTTVAREWNEGVYYGDILKGQPHGFGRWIRYDDKGRYVGHWKNGRYHGSGELTDPIGIVTKG